MEYYWGLIIGATVVIFIVVSYQIYKRKKRQKLVEKLQEVGDVKQIKDKACDLILTINQKQIYVKLLDIGRTSELSINSKRHWQLDPSTRKLYLLKTGGFERLQQPKMLLVYPAPKKIVKYINENEVVFVKYDEKCFDFHLFTESEIDKIKEVYT